MRRKVAPNRRLLAFIAAACALGVLLQARQAASQQATLVGWATMPVDTFAPGPTTGQFAGAGQFGHALPVRDKQVVQGFSAVINGPVPGTYYVIIDNGFGTKANSADSLLRVYAIRPTFRTQSGGDATVSAVNVRTGAVLPSFTADSFITLSDPDRKLGFPITADQATYYGRPDAPAVAPEIRQGRLLTGADLDPESFRRTADGHFWFGDEFGPFLIETDAQGRVLRPAVSLPGVFAPENLFRGEREANLGSSRGFEGLAMSPDGRTLFALLEGVVTGDPAGLLRVHEFSIPRGAFTGQTFKYRLDSNGTNIGDMTSVNDHEFLVVERNGSAGDGATPPAFKKIFRIDRARLDADGAAAKTEVIDLMNVADPADLDRDGKTTFTFPFVTIEDVLMIDANTVLVINDNNYPGGGGRGQTSDRTEVLLIRIGAGTSSSDAATGFGSITGRVVDRTRAGLPGAIVTALPEGSGTVETMVTDTDGRYSFTSLPAGTYRVDAESVGFDVVRRNQLVVPAGGAVQEDVTLGACALSECVTRPGPPLVQRKPKWGRVLDAAGRFVPHAGLRIQNEAAHADARGEFSYLAPSRDVWTLMAVDPLLGSATIKLSGREPDPLIIRLQAAPTIASVPILETLVGCHCAGLLGPR